jgi:hypothetical protein
VWLVCGQQGAGAAARGERADLDLWMAQQQPEQFATRVSAGTGHRRSHCHVDDYALLCKFNQESKMSAASRTVPP